MLCPCLAQHKASRDGATRIVLARLPGAAVFVERDAFSLHVSHVTASIPAVTAVASSIAVTSLAVATTATTAAEAETEGEAASRCKGSDLQGQAKHRVRRCSHGAWHGPWRHCLSVARGMCASTRL